jgi:SSS family solute:Na+ symporter
VGPDIYSRLFCAKDEQVAKSSALWAGLAIIPISLFIIIIGMGAKILYPDIPSEQAFPTVIGELLPVGLSGLVLAALLAAIMSSADTCLLTTSTIFTEDIYKRIFPGTGEKKRLMISRLGIVIIGIVALLIALQLGGVISSLLLAYTIYTSGIVLPVLVGFHKDKFKVNSYGALAAIIGGGGTALVVKLLGGGTKLDVRLWDANDFQLLGFGICAFLLFSVSWITRRSIHQQ